MSAMIKDYKIEPILTSEKVSIVVTTYGRTDLLYRAVESVLNQTYRNIELIIVDDNASIEMAHKIDEIIDSFDDHRIKIIHNECNVGGALARNIGINSSSGNYIAFLDDDDIYCKDKIEKQINLFHDKCNDKLALVYCWDKVIDSNGTVVYEHKNQFSGNCLYEGMLDCIASTSLWMCQRDALLNVGGFTNTPCKQDSLLIMKLLSGGYELDYVPEYLVIYDDGGNDRISRQSHCKRIVGEEKLLLFCRENYESLTKTQIREVEYAFAARLIVHYAACKKYKSLMRCLFVFARTHPFKRYTLSCIKKSVYHVIHG